MTTLPPQAARSDSHPGSTSPLVTTTEPSSWMPLEGLAQTWASFASIFLTQPAFMAFAAATQARDFTFASLGVFFNGADGIVFLAPVVTHELLSIHGAFHAAFAHYAVAELDYYLPGNWVPHCTLALNVPRDRVPAVVDASSRLAGLPLRGRFESMGLFQFQPAKDIYTAPLARGS